MSDTASELRAAFAAAQAGRLAEAAERCREILDREPGRVEAHYLLGLEAAQRGEHELAAGHLRSYLEQHRGDSDAWFNLGVVQQQAGKLDQAARAYGRVLRRRPEAINARVNLATTLRAADRLEEALALLAEAPPASASDPALRVVHAECLAAAGDDDAALARIGTVDAGADERLLLALARMRLARGEAAAAIPMLREAVHGRESAALEDALSVLLASTGAMDEAIERAQRATMLAPTRAAYWFNLAAALSRRTARAELGEAHEATERCLELAPGHAAAWHCRGLVAAKLGLDEGAAASLERAVALAPGNIRYAVDHGDFLVRSGEVQRGIEVLERAAAGPDPTGEAARQLGVALLHEPRAEAALAALSRAEARAPVDQRVIAHRALALQHLGRHADAEDYLGLDRHIRRVTLAAPPGFPDLASFNAALANDIRNHSRLRWEPIGLAARNGALTEELLADRTPAILGFEARLRQAIEALRTSVAAHASDPFLRRIPDPGYELNIWATCVQGGGHIDTHIHEESWLSGAYYVHLPAELGRDDEDPAGWIEFGRPHAELVEPAGLRLDLIRPEEGLLVLFPSYLFHRTLPHPAGSDRISISFDLVPR